MTSFYETSHQHAFSDTVGALGAERARYEHWLKLACQKAPALRDTPQREAAPVLSIASKTDDLDEIETIATDIMTRFKALVVVGMGGSSLSAEVLSYLRKAGSMPVRFVDNIDPTSFDRLIAELDFPKTAFLVISKSGGTVETHAQMSVLLRAAQKQIGENYPAHFTVITIANDNPLHRLATMHNMRVVPHDPDLGGRFSILSSVGLIPAKVMGLDIRALRAGAQEVLDAHYNDLEHAPAIQGAALQMALTEKQTRQHVLLHYNDAISGFALWYRQSWGESLGKCDRATSPVIARGATDQHSQLQLYLDGPKDKCYTVMMIDSSGAGAAIDYDDADARLDYLKGHTLGDLMVAEQRATVDTLVQRGCPTRTMMLKAFDEQVLGGLVMHFALEIMFTAALLEINAFDQPAVEDAKKIALTYLASGSKSGRKSA